MNNKLERVEKRVKIRGKANYVVRELYLRDDILCHSPLCTNCKNSSETKRMELSKEASHYAIPSFDVVQKYLEILELPEIKGLILLQSVVAKALQSIGRGHYKRLLNLNRDCRRGCATFLNEICIHTHVKRSASQSEEQWLSRCLVKVAHYYAQHLNSAIPIIIITEKPELLHPPEELQNIEVLNVKSYIERKWENCKQALELYESITIAKLSSTSSKDESKNYDSYLPSDVLHSGIKAGKFIRGFLRVNKHLSQHEAFVTSSVLYKKELGDILIYGMKHRNRAIHGDDVVVEVLPKNEWKSRSFSLVAGNEEAKDGRDLSATSQMPSGEVVGILERQWRDYVATIPDETEENMSMSKSSTERILVVPYDNRIPRIRIATKQANQLRNQRLIVRIDSWDKASQYPNGHFVRSLGEIGNLDTEVKCLLVEYGISALEFPGSLLPELPVSTKEKPWTVEESEVLKRRDLRKSHLVFSIDPKGCEDVDDTLSVKKMSDGTMEIGVHIADVTYFVKQSSLTDLEARSRSTSVYLPDRRYDMLPHVLSADLCSLLGNVDRYAVSVLWKLDANFEVLDVWYGRTVIRSSYKLCYEDAEDMLNEIPAEEMKKKITELQGFNDADFLQRFTELKAAVCDLVTTANELRAKRLSTGGLELNSINVKFEIDKSLPSIIKDFRQVEELEVHKTVAEFMIFANSWVAKQISTAFPQQAVLRRHPHPRENDLQELQKLAAIKGFFLKIGSNKELAQSLTEACDPENPNVNQIFRILATRAMNEATYFCCGAHTPEEFYHYGLGINHYTHFTSPIRRYSDVMVHRLLLASVGEESSTNLFTKVSDIELLCSHMNEKHRAAQDVEKAAQVLFQAYYFSDPANDKRCLANGLIYSIKANGLLVFIPRYDIRGAVCLLNKDNQVAIEDDGVKWVEGSIDKSETNLTVKSGNIHHTYSIFDEITVRINVLKRKAHQPNIVLDLFSCQPYESNRSRSPENSLAAIKVEPPSKDRTENCASANEIADSDGDTKDKKPSLYQLLLSLREMTLRPLPNSGFE